VSLSRLEEGLGYGFLNRESYNETDPKPKKQAKSSGIDRSTFAGRVTLSLTHREGGTPTGDRSGLPWV